MGKQIVWTSQGLTSFSEIYNYLQNEFSAKTADKFRSKVKEKVVLISNFPKIGKKSLDKEKFRFVVVDKNHKIYYRVRGKKLYIFLIFDTRQSPKKNPF